VTYPVNSSFAFFKTHFVEAKTQEPKYRREVENSLQRREESAKIVLAAVSGEREKALLGEMLRDIRIFRSRMTRLKDKMDALEGMVTEAEVSNDPRIASAAVEAFHGWRDSRYDFCGSLAAAITKWRGYEKDIFSHMQQ
jgi:hypothetical protein